MFQVEARSIKKIGVKAKEMKILNSASRSWILENIFD